MTRKEFIDILATEWPDVPVMLESASMQLPRLCLHLASDAFVFERKGPAIDELRAQLLHLEDAGSFKLDGY